MRRLWREPGVKTFAVVWSGQLVSNLGSSMTSFGLAIWVFDKTGSVLQLSLIVMAAQAPALLVSPFAGALVDRWDRRKAMLLADTGAAAGTLAAIILILTGALETWHLYVTLSFSGLFSAFQYPAYSAAVTLMIPKEHYARASGLVQLAGGIGRVAAPAIAAAVVVTSGLGPIFIVDFVTYLCAVATLAFVAFPKAPPSTRRGAGIRGLALEAKEGLEFVLGRRALLVLLLSFLMVNFAFAFQSVLMVPLLLSLTSEQMAGFVVSIGAVAIVTGSLLLSVWGGPVNRVAGVYVPIAAMGVGLIAIGIRPVLEIVIAGSILMHGTHPVAGGSSQSIWQSKVPPELQGRVFAIRQVTAIAATPIAYLLAGILADGLLEPLMTDATGPMAAIFGTGAGRGIGVLFVATGILAIITVIVAIRHPRIRNLEIEIPDAVPART